jgi:signal peptidase I
MRRLRLGVPALVVLLAGCGGGKVYKINSGAMEPTLRLGQAVAIDTHSRAPKTGQIVAYYAPRVEVGAMCANHRQGVGHKQACGQAGSTRSNAVFIKRVVGSPGDSIAIAGGRVVRNGKRAAETYVRPCDDSPCNFPRAVTIPPGEYFVLGDNRASSYDSRFYGPIPRAWIIGTKTG